ncbi:MAG TPA: bifunctional 4-hydroxy-2-oxoglutarate aldolase/2-dehydro-3-deoxy-phosphogluconate aldolase [Clostridiaceae bacterium]|nr:bifunctional 4-hydroxy-2-oxoglutarate aldolase/2-dehydro-3-deoxy-phosphogluconate aldolase [Clostridiaceae bacterium]
MVLNRIKDTKVVAILRNLSHDDNFFVMDHLLEAGITNFEVSLTTDNAVKVIEEAVKKYGAKAMVGAGTVLTEKQAREVIEVGAEFIFAPNFSEKIVTVAKNSDIFIAPGVFSPTEIYAAHEMGCSLVKLFPASTVGSSYIKQILSPLEGIEIIAVGGIDHTNMDEYLKAGACSVGVGSSMTPKKMIAERDSEALIAHIKQYIR